MSNHSITAAGPASAACLLYHANPKHIAAQPTRCGLRLNTSNASNENITANKSGLRRLAHTSKGVEPSHSPAGIKAYQRPSRGASSAQIRPAIASAAASASKRPQVKDGPKSFIGGVSSI